MNKKGSFLKFAAKAVMIGAPILSVVASFVDKKQTTERNDQLIADSVRAEVEKQLKALPESSKEV